MKDNEPTPPEPEIKYYAFISYSHKDRKWGDWLHRGIEAYRVPTALAGRPSRDGSVPRRLFPVFRDREELPVSADLGANLKHALETSRYLVVICSPAAARSKWVNEEVIRFKTRHGESRLLCMIVDGTPNGSDQPETAELECFPPAVRHQVLPGGEFTGERTEPIAADVRPGGDGPKRAKFKILAGLLAVNFDDLWQRERRRRIRGTVQWAIWAVALALAVGGAWRWHELRQARLLDIVKFMEEGELKMREGHRLEAAGYFAKGWRRGGSGPRIEGALRDAGRALIEPAAILGPGDGGHSVWITSATFLDDTHVVTTGWDKKVLLWDLAAKKAAQLAEEADKVACASFSADGSRFVTAVWNGTANLRARDGTPPTPLDHAGKRVNWAAFSPDGTRVVTACDDTLARIWDTAHPEAGPLLLKGHESFVKAAYFSGDGQRVVTASFDTTAKVWDAVTGQRAFSLVPHPAALNAAAFSPDGRQIATGCLDGSVFVWDANPDDKARVPKPRPFAGHNGKRVNSVAFDRDGTRLVTAGDDRTAKVWDVTTGELLLSFEAHREIVVHASFSPDGRRVVTASKDRTAMIFDARPLTRTPEEIAALAEKLAPPAAIQGGK